MYLLPTCCCCDLRRGIVALGIVLIAIHLIGLPYTLYKESDNVPQAVLELISVSTAIACYGLLIYGAIKRKRWFLLPAMVLFMLEIVLSVVGIITLIALLKDVATPLIVAACFLFGLLLLWIYFWYTIFSYFMRLKQGETADSNA